MPIGVATPRDKFDQLIAFVRRMMHYWWLIGIISFVGGVLAIAFALSQKPRFLSEARILYNERIQSSILQGRNVAVNTRNLGFRYQEMLMSRTVITEIINELDLFAKERAKEGDDAAVEAFLKQAKFRVRGASLFYISYFSDDPQLSQKVTEIMVKRLFEEDQRLREESASSTLRFLESQKAKVSEQLDKRRQELTEFLTKHPVFALDTTPGAANTPGTVIRAQHGQGGDERPTIAVNQTPQEAADSVLQALLRQERRIRATLRNPDEARPSGPTPEQREAQQLVNELERDERRAQTNLDDALRVNTSQHPDVIKAQQRLREIQRRLARAKAAVPEAPKAPEIDRRALERELRDFNKRIDARKRQIREESGGDAEEVAEPEPANREASEAAQVVELETTYASLNEAVSEARERLAGVDAALSRAEIAASQQEEGAVLSMIDQPSLPSRPQGKGRGIIVIAITMVFIVLGVLLVFALALLDDRIYNPNDLEKLAVAPVAVVIPKQRRRSRWRRKRTRSG